MDQPCLCRLAGYMSSREQDEIKGMSQGKQETVWMMTIDDYWLWRIEEGYTVLVTAAFRGLGYGGLTHTFVLYISFVLGVVSLLVPTLYVWIIGLIAYIKGLGQWQIMYNI
jgi:hypothetical protein